MMDSRLEPMPEDRRRMLAIVAHPDGLEYGAASAIARWTRAGKSVGYVVVTNGEAGIDGLPPHQAGPIRVAEQQTSAKIVGVDDVTFLGYRDGVVENGLALRRDLARAIVGGGFGLLELRPVRMSLEEIFLSLTTEERPEEEAAHA